jgi:putative (di)nucleoside polyphosphate hydrolase
MESTIDKHGFRPNVGIVLLQTPPESTAANRVLWARRIGGYNAWQFPQGGIHVGESPEDAVYREVQEEIGVAADAVTILGQTSDWLRYRLPKHMRRNNSTPGFVGQKQKWFLLQLHAPDDAVRLDLHAKPEFDDWQWVSYYYPIGQVVDFKQDVYRGALVELAQYLPNASHSAGQSVNQANTG